MRQAPAFLIVLALVLAGCGGDDETDKFGGAPDAVGKCLRDAKLNVSVADAPPNENATRYYVNAADVQAYVLDFKSAGQAKDYLSQLGGARKGQEVHGASVITFTGKGSQSLPAIRRCVKA